MKNKILKSLLVSCLLSTGVYAYEASNINVNWIGFKTQNKVGVAGTFNKSVLTINQNADFSKFLTSAKVNIDISSLDSKMKFRDKNITSTLFKIAGITEIKANVVKVAGDDTKGVIDVEIDMNNVKKVIPMKYAVEAGVLKASGVVDVINHSMSESFNAFATKCKPFHAGKTWSEVSVSFDLPFKK